MNYKRTKENNSEIVLFKYLPKSFTNKKDKFKKKSNKNSPFEKLSELRFR